MDVRPIDANALAELLNEMVGDCIKSHCGGFFPHGISKGLNDAYRATINAPTLDYAPVVHAYWERNDDDTGWFRELCFCSACGIGTHPYETKYCPSCGAKMDGGKKDD